MDNKDLYLALSNAHPHFPAQVKDSKGQRSKYVKLPDMIDSVFPILKTHGLHLLQKIVFRDQLPILITKIMHLESGQYEESEFPLSLDDVALQHNSRVQVEGGSQTYHRRYQIKLILGIAEEEEDIDGEYKKNRETVKNETSQENIVNGVKMITEKQLGLLKSLLIKDTKSLEIILTQVDKFEELTQGEASSWISKLKDKA